ncbi:MAG TPA: hypothetical protein VGO40_24830 [Longimicrobium sp.]|jgi:hypothetical protein|nr:hypothetical protein [Longimicrobium sp.]
MKKLRFELNDLQVETFGTAAAPASPGTVNANAGSIAGPTCPGFTWCGNETCDYNTCPTGACHC